MNTYCVAFSTIGSEPEARSLARELVERSAAACVTIIPDGTSIYKWKGRLCEDSEWLLMIKTRFEKREAIEAILKESHPYEVPELIFLPISAGSKPYLSWLAKSLSPQD